MSSISRSPRLDLAGVGVELQVADLERGGAARRPAPQQGADPCQQLAALEGLDEVVVGAAVEAVDPVLGLGPRGQHQDRHVAVGAQAAADLDPVEAGQAEIEHDQVGDEAGGDVERVDAVGRGAHLVALVAQRAAQDVGDSASSSTSRTRPPTWVGVGKHEVDRYLKG